MTQKFEKVITSEQGGEKSKGIKAFLEKNSGKLIFASLLGGYAAAEHFDIANWASVDEIMYKDEKEEGDKAWDIPEDASALERAGYAAKNLPIVGWFFDDAQKGFVGAVPAGDVPLPEPLDYSDTLNEALDTNFENLEYFQSGHGNYEEFEANLGKVLSSLTPEGYVAQAERNIQATIAEYQAAGNPLDAAVVEQEMQSAIEQSKTLAPLPEGFENISTISDINELRTLIQSIEDPIQILSFYDSVPQLSEMGENIFTDDQQEVINSAIVEGTVQPILSYNVVDKLVGDAGYDFGADGSATPTQDFKQFLANINQVALNLSTDPGNNHRSDFVNDLMGIETSSGNPMDNMNELVNSLWESLPGDENKQARFELYAVLKKYEGVLNDDMNGMKFWSEGFKKYDDA